MARSHRRVTEWFALSDVLADTFLVGLADERSDVGTRRLTCED
jgi:hypothetical protein